MKKICVITATRAEYGLLKYVIKKIDDDDDLELCLVATGMHLSPDFGMTLSEIEADGFEVAEKIDILLSSDSEASISKSMGLAFISFSDFFARQKPELLIVLGDRFELLPICGCAVNAHIPIAHIAGGDTTEGAVDECYRHCITKMSYLHFPSNSQCKQRIIQMGESPDRVFDYGFLGLEIINSCSFLTKEQLEKSLGIKLSKVYMSVTFHPVTLEKTDALKQLNELLMAIESFPEIQFIITKANADASGKTINRRIDSFVATHDNCEVFSSLGISRYLSLLKYSQGILGNSSSGISEAPSFGIPTVNIGNRQKGRPQARSVINCRPIHQEIEMAIRKSQTNAFLQNAKKAINPYGSADTSALIVKTIKSFLDNNKVILQKEFFALEYSYEGG